MEFQLQHQSFQRIFRTDFFRIEWFDLLATQVTLKSLLQHHSSKASILWCSVFFIVQLSCPYMTTRKTIALTRNTFVGKVMSLFSNMLSRLVITFLPRSKHLLISWLQSPSAVILEPRKIKSDTVSGPVTSWQTEGKKVERVTDFPFLGSKITVVVDCSHEIRRHSLLGRKAMTNLDSVLRSRGITLPTKVYLVKAMAFPVVIYGCENWKAECQRSDAFKLWC